jgi:hypothetical protein
MFIAADTTATTVLVAPINKEDRVLELERQLAEQAKRIGRLEFMLLQTTMTAVTLNEPAPEATSSSAMPSSIHLTDKTPPTPSASKRGPSAALRA